VALPEFQDRTLTEAERERWFRRATSMMCGADDRWNERAERPMTNSELAEALRFEIHTEGGGGCRDTPDYWYNVSGLRVWVGWNVNPCRDKPTWQGVATVAMARQVYDIRSGAESPQMSLF
jgi:hypothetical protein